MNKAQLKEIIKNCIIEVTQKDINAVHPKISNVDDLNKLSLSNLKALRDKTKRFIDAELKKDEPDEIEINKLNKTYVKFNDEINKRLKYINKPV